MFAAERITRTDFETNRLIEFIRPPFRRYELLTPMSPADAASVLEEIVEPRKIFRWPFSRGHRYFEGWVAPGRFKITRITDYGSGFLPVIEGNFRPDNSGTIVAMKLRLMWPAIVFTFGLIMILFWVCVSINSIGARMLMLGAALFLYLFATVPFAIEIRIAMKRLLKLPWFAAADPESSR